MTIITYTRDHAFNYGKQKLINILTDPDFNPDTYTDYHKDINSYIKYLKTTSQLPKVPEKPSDVDKTDDEDTTDDPAILADDSADNPAPEDDKLIGVFQKNLSGGVVKHADKLKNGMIFIGESWTRTEGLSDGDLVEVLDYDYDTDHLSGIRLYKQQDPEVPQNIQTFKFGIVDSVYTKKHTQPLDVNHPFIITTSVNGDDLDFSYRLSEEDIDRFELAKGDVVDLAWYDGSINTCRVIWKHKTDYKPTETIEQKRLNHTSEKETTSSTPNVFTDNQFEGLTICLVGMDMYKDKFKQAVEDRAGSFIHVDPKASRVRREAEYLKADIIMLGLQQISHESSNHAVAFAKQENILYGSFNGHGTGPFILEVISKLQLIETG